VYIADLADSMPKSGRPTVLLPLLFKSSDVRLATLLLLLLKLRARLVLVGLELPGSNAASPASTLANVTSMLLALLLEVTVVLAPAMLLAAEAEADRAGTRNSCRL
jgi:hypothetical protein